MTDTDKIFYKEMLKRDRLIPFIDNGILICFITFYLTNNPERYITNNPWEVLEDEQEGRICVISQLITDKVSHWENHKLCYQVWKRFKDYIKLNFPKVEEIYWHRWKDKKVNVHKMIIKKEM